MQKTIYLILVVLVGLLFYSATIRAIKGNPDAVGIYKSRINRVGPFETSHEISSYAQVVSFVKYKRLDIPKELADLAPPDIGYYDGRFYSLFPPGLPLLAIPFFLLGEMFNLAQLFTFAVVPLFSIGVMVLLFKISLEIFKFSRNVSIIPAFLFAFGTTSWNYATTFFQHSASTFFILLAFYSVWRFRQENSYRWLWGIIIWTCAGFSLYLDYPNGFLMIPVIAYFFWTSIQFIKESSSFKISFHHSFLTASIVFLILFSAQLYLNQKHFDSWKTFSNTLIMYDGNIETAKKRLADPNIIRNEQKLREGFVENRILKGVRVLLFAPDKGLFVFSPVFLLSLFGLYKLRKKFTEEGVVLLGLVAVNLLFYSSFWDPWGGWSYGPRYLIPSMAILSIFVAAWIENVSWKFSSRSLFLILFAYSSAMALFGTLTLSLLRPVENSTFADLKGHLLSKMIFFHKNLTGSFVYNNYFINKITLLEYFFIIYWMLLAVFAVVLFILPYFEKEKERVDGPPAPTVPSELAVGDKKIPIVPAKERPKKLRIKVV